MEESASSKELRRHGNSLLINVLRCRSKRLPLVLILLTVVFVAYVVVSGVGPPSSSSSLGYRGSRSVPPGSEIDAPPVPPSFPPRTDAQLAWFHQILQPNATTNTNDNHDNNGPLACREVMARLRRGEWKDPNGGQGYFRLVDSQPPFYVSVHLREYDDMRFRTIFVRGNYYETLVRNRFEQILAESHRLSQTTTNTNTLPLVLDVGGNIGYYTLLSAVWNHAVVTFEINPSNLIRLCESLHLNQPDDTAVAPVTNPMPVVLFQKAVSDTDGTRLAVHVPARNPGEASIQPLPLDADAASTTSTTTTTTTTTTTLHSSVASTVTLDQFARDRGWLDPQRSDVVIRILKVDVEGHEAPILHQAKALLESGRVHNVLTEFRNLLVPANQQALEILLQAGFGIVDHQLVDKHNMALGSTKRVLTTEQSREYLARVAREMKSVFNTHKYVDLWFQLLQK